jgi:cell shape-determining protein MreC
MQNYVKNSASHTCSVCNGKFKDYNEYKHKQSLKHKAAQQAALLNHDKSDFDVLKQEIEKLKKLIESK